MLINLAILISGRGSNMFAILESLDKGKIHNVKDVVVVSNNMDAQGLVIAKNRFNIKTEVVSRRNPTRQEMDESILEILHKYDITPQNGLICLAGFMKVLGPKIISSYQNRIMNIHPSLLPSFKGLNAQRQAIMAGVKISGCTVHFVTNELDGGPIILQNCVPVYDKDDEKSLSERILVKEHEIYPEAINLFTNNKLVLENNRVVQK